MKHELTGKISGVSFSYTNGKPLVTFELNEKRSAMDMVDTLREYDKLAIRIDRYKAKRSLDANAYAWVLIGKIAEKTNVPTNEVYRAAIKEVGGNYDVVCIKDEALEKLRSAWHKNGIGWQTATLPSRIEGCTNVILYYGSSTYDVSQMGRLITNLQQDCSALGIEVKSPEEVESLLNSWRSKYET